MDLLLSARMVAKQGERCNEESRRFVGNSPCLALAAKAGQIGFEIRPQLAWCGLSRLGMEA